MSKDNKQYCFKIKYGYLKLKDNNAYSKAKIENYGFYMYVPENEDDEDIFWAKNLKLDKNCSIAKWVKKDTEKIYQKEKENQDSHWVKEILEAGYEFNEDGTLIENEKFEEGLNVQLCIAATGPYHGTLFINMGGLVEFYDSEVLLECAPQDIEYLLSNGVAYKKRYHDEA